ncbi:MAG: AAA family ATPase, partial [Pseudomonadota bacterium]
MFVDLVGSTKLAHALEPEEFAEVLLSYQRVTDAAARRFGGTAARFVGDGVLVLFGWPQARQTDPEGAVRAALQIHAELGKKRGTQEAPLQARIGIATGTALVGDLVDERIPQSNTVIGETPHLAARLQGLAGPGETVVGESTQTRVTALFECHALGRMKVSGFDAPVNAYRVTREREVADRLSRLVREDATPLIGRGKALEVLRSKWREAGNGRGQIVLISGEAGIGKSRLMLAQRTDEALGPHRIVTYHCSPFHQQSALFPFLTHLGRWSGINEADTAPERRAKIADRVAALLSPEQFELLISLAVPGESQAGASEAVSEQDYWVILREIFRATLRNYATDAPLLLHFEDIHWIDPSSRRVLKSMVKVFAELPVLLVLSHQPGADTSYFKGTHVTRLPLHALPVAEAHKMVSVVGTDAIEPEVADLIVQKTNGVPLFIEEYTAAIL